MIYKIQYYVYVHIHFHIHNLNELDGETLNYKGPIYVYIFIYIYTYTFTYLLHKYSSLSTRCLPNDSGDTLSTFVSLTFLFPCVYCCFNPLSYRYMIYSLKSNSFVSLKHGLQTSYIGKLNEWNRLDRTLGVQVREANWRCISLKQKQLIDSATLECWPAFDILSYLSLIFKKKKFNLLKWYLLNFKVRIYLIGFFFNFNLNLVLSVPFCNLCFQIVLPYISAVVLV